MSGRSHARSEPRVWVLLGKGAGGNAQMRLLADALGWPTEYKELAYNRLEHLPNPLLGASGLSLRRQRSSPLEPPWPDLAIGASRRSAPVALWIRRRSGGRTRLVHLFHTMTPLDRFDLVLTLPQYRLPPAPNVVELVAPLQRPVPLDRQAAAARRWRPEWERLPRPWTALLVGGDSSSFRLGAPTARRLGSELSARVRRRRGSLLVTTSPRTPAEATDALFAAIDCPAFAYRFRRGDPENPYPAFLALADEFVVTTDSASLLAEACGTGRPVRVFAWKPRRSVKRWIFGGGDTGLRSALVTRLVASGLLKPPRDFDALHRALAERGLVEPWDASATAPRERAPLDDLERAVAAVRRLVERGPGAVARSPARLASGGAVAAGSDLALHSRRLEP